MRWIWLILVTALLWTETESAVPRARGRVFHDRNGNGVLDGRERGVPGIRVSNGRDIVLSDRKGRYEIEAPEHGAVFVIQPPDWRAPLDELNRPRFYHMHKPEGSPPLEFAGSAPTGPLPESLDFPLNPTERLDRFAALVLGDTQPGDQREIDYLAHDVLEDLAGTDAVFAAVLGDVVGDDLSLFPPLCRAMTVLDLPVHYVAGNHDENYDSAADRYSLECFEAQVGPSYYSFEVGRVHFVVLDDVLWRGKVADPEAWQGGNYIAGLGERQRAWLERDLELTPQDMLVLPMMHIPFNHPWDEAELSALLDLLAGRRRCFSMAAHAHYMEHDFITAAEGWPGEGEHHQLIAPTACGGWWTGAKDEYGLPHSMMRDGAPNGSMLAVFEGADYRLEFLPARRAASHQMSLWAPEEVALAEAPATEIVANVFAGSERSKVEFRLDGEGAWRPMRREPGEDPYLRAINAMEEAAGLSRYERATRASKGTGHIWRAKLPAAESPGLRVIEVRETDMFGQVHLGRRAIRFR